MNDAHALHVPLIRRQLLTWYGRHQRLLPWRQSRPDPYRTLVSEAMLQQTQVATVIGYFERFVERFPTIALLAQADIDEVLPYWSGLGYYRRCHHLHAAAQYIVMERKGRWPASAAEWMTLPGVGRYTAGAVASIAFGQCEPAVDGNARRVLGRLAGLEQITDPGQLETKLWALAKKLVPRSRPGDFNQAVMELGSRICRPRSPLCHQCPIRRQCRHFAFTLRRATGDALPISPPQKRPPTRPLNLVALSIGHRDRFWYRQRPNNGLWAGLWEWPTVERQNDQSKEAAARVICDELRVSFDGNGEWLGPIRCQLTHRDVSIDVLSIQLRESGKLQLPGQWLRNTDLGAVGLSAAQRRLLTLVPTPGERHGTGVSLSVLPTTRGPATGSARSLARRSSASKR